MHKILAFMPVIKKIQLHLTFRYGFAVKENLLRKSEQDSDEIQKCVWNSQFELGPPVNYGQALSHSDETCAQQLDVYV